MTASPEAQAPAALPWIADIPIVGDVASTTWVDWGTFRGA